MYFSLFVISVLFFPFIYTQQGDDSRKGVTFSQNPAVTGHTDECFIVNQVEMLLECEGNAKCTNLQRLTFLLSVIEHRRQKAIYGINIHRTTKGWLIFFDNLRNLISTIHLKKISLVEIGQVLEEYISRANLIQILCTTPDRRLNKVCTTLQHVDSDYQLHQLVTYQKIAEILEFADSRNNDYAKDILKKNILNKYASKKLSEKVVIRLLKHLKTQNYEIQKIVLMLAVSMVDIYDVVLLVKKFLLKNIFCLNPNKDMHKLWVKASLKVVNALNIHSGYFDAIRAINIAISKLSSSKTKLHLELLLKHLNILNESEILAEVFTPIFFASDLDWYKEIMAIPCGVTKRAEMKRWQKELSDFYLLFKFMIDSQQFFTF